MEDLERQVDLLNKKQEQLYAYVTFIEERTKLHLKLFYLIAALTIADAMVAAWHILSTK